tara:strand:+ start:2843 stop:3496 length:654 start_codon:yes stop_codon:yes gene_type:complete
MVIDKPTLVEIIKSVIFEELGKHKTRIFKGNGASHSYNKKPEPNMLGDLDPFDVEKEPEEEPPQKINTSQAFKENKKDISESSVNQFKPVYDSGINYKENPGMYRTTRDSQGVYTVMPYKKDLIKYFSFSSPKSSKESAQKIYELFESYRDKNDFIGMDMARKYLQLGYKLSKRFEKYPSGKKSLKNESGDRAMSQSASAFRKKLIKVMKDKAYNPF